MRWPSRSPYFITHNVFICYVRRITNWYIDDMYSLDRLTHVITETAERVNSAHTDQFMDWRQLSVRDVVLRHENTWIFAQMLYDNIYFNAFSMRLCGLVVRVPGFRSRGPGFDSRHYQIVWEVVGQERGSFSLVNISEELLDWKSSGSVSR
jgi:hypothetical protein